MTLSLLGWGGLALLVFWVIGAYNRVMLLRNAIGAAYAQLDEHMSARAEACTRLVALLRPLLPSEQASLDALESSQAETRSLAQTVRAKPFAGDPVGSLAVAAAVHAAALTRLLSLLDHHAELREHPEVFALMDEIRLLERQRSFARQLFNQAVQRYNEAIAQFPTRLITAFFGFAEARSL